MSYNLETINQTNPHFNELNLLNKFNSDVFKIIRHYIKNNDIDKIIKFCYIMDFRQLIFIIMEKENNLNENYFIELLNKELAYNMLKYDNIDDLGNICRYVFDIDTYNNFLHYLVNFYKKRILLKQHKIIYNVLNNFNNNLVDTSKHLYTDSYKLEIAINNDFELIQKYYKNILLCFKYNSYNNLKYILSFFRGKRFALENKLLQKDVFKYICKYAYIHNDNLEKYLISVGKYCYFVKNYEIFIFLINKYKKKKSKKYKIIEKYFMDLINNKYAMMLTEDNMYIVFYYIILIKKKKMLSLLDLFHVLKSHFSEIFNIYMTLDDNNLNEKYKLIRNNENSRNFKIILFKCIIYYTIITNNISIYDYYVNYIIDNNLIDCNSLLYIYFLIYNNQHILINKLKNIDTKFYSISKKLLDNITFNTAMLFKKEYISDIKSKLHHKIYRLLYETIQNLNLENIIENTPQIIFY